ncbi:vWA domain-containing protein [Tamlana crocina]|uniref:VWA domain-containing protein n=1 Tax=Tamlana crocina TaxID=393006 RepID=A0ABX1DEY0_9FLAO|nr:VWA domain-containing protein [Tamlana crocina]NJX15801.1 VWA domain-containing protein [Tamlana crocina]
MKKFHLLFLIAFIFAACSKDSDNNQDEAAFENLNDQTTVAIETTIPRMEISQSGNNITILLSVTDQDGTPLEQFTLGNYTIKVYVNGDDAETIAQNKIVLSEFEQLNNKPLAAATTMDYSGSMGYYDKLEMEEALRNFIGLKNSNDLMSIIKFASTIEEVQPFTTDATLLDAAIDLKPGIGFSTAFYSACDLGLDQVNKLSNVLPVVIGFTDGYDNSSNINLDDLIDKSKNLVIPIYTVGFGGTDEDGLQYLADETGGRYFYAPTNEDISNLYQLISQQLRKLYVLDWSASYSTGTELTIEITTEYTSANGSFTSTSTKSIIIQ